MIYIFIYLLAAVLSNLVATYFGVKAIFYVAFFIIPLDLLSRDVLHQRWHGNHVFLRITSIILVGSVLSYILNKDAQVIAIASFCSFLGAGLVDMFVYQFFYKKPLFIKMNLSNLFAAFADSVLFITIAFGFNWKYILIQTAVKFLGGLIWSYLYIRLKK